MNMLRDLRIYVLIMILSFTYNLMFFFDFFGLIEITASDFTYEMVYDLLTIPCFYFAAAAFAGYLVKKKMIVNVDRGTLDLLFYVSFGIFLLLILSVLGIFLQTISFYIQPSELTVDILLTVVYGHPELFLVLGLITSVGISERNSYGRERRYYYDI